MHIVSLVHSICPIFIFTPTLAVDLQKPTSSWPKTISSTLDHTDGNPRSFKALCLVACKNSYSMVVPHGQKYFFACRNMCYSPAAR